MSLFFTEFHNGQRKIFDLFRKKGYNIRQERRTMEDTKNLNTEFQSNLEYVLTNLEKDILQASNLEDKLYLEMSKDEIIDSLNYVYKIIKCWENSYNKKQYKNIINKYSEIESIVSKLELCLADYEEHFHMDGISYSVFLIGKILSNIIKESDKNG